MIFLENHVPKKLKKYVIAKRDWIPTLEQEIQAFYLGIKLQKLKAGNIYKKLVFQNPIKHYFNGMNVEIKRSNGYEYSAIVVNENIGSKNSVLIRPSYKRKKNIAYLKKSDIDH